MADHDATTMPGEKVPAAWMRDVAQRMYELVSRDSGTALDYGLVEQLATLIATASPRAGDDEAATDGASLWTERERKMVDALMADRQMSERGLIRQSVRFYAAAIDKIKAGETCTWSGDAQRAREFSGLSTGAATDAGVREANAAGFVQVLRLQKTISEYLAEGVDKADLDIEGGYDGLVEYCRQAADIISASTRPSPSDAERVREALEPAPGLRPTFLSAWPRPWRYEESGYNEGPCIRDKNGQLMATLSWPLHHPDATKMVEAQMFHLGLLWSCAVETFQGAGRRAALATPSAGPGLTEQERMLVEQLSSVMRFDNAMDHMVPSDLRQLIGMIRRAYPSTAEPRES